MGGVKPEILVWSDFSRETVDKLCQADSMDQGLRKKFQDDLSF